MNLNERIFLVDDDPIWTAIIYKTLTRIGYRNITCFSNGQDCIQSLHLNPTTIFLDYQMDDLNGIEVLEKVKAYSPNINVIFCTAHEDLSVAVNAIDLGSYDYLLKSHASPQAVILILSHMAEYQSLNFNA